MSSFYCYCLERHDKKQRYIGATVDPDRRLKQHQGILSGGAKATQGKVWTRVCLIGGFPTWNDALKFEWRWKRFSYKHKGWQKGLEALMALEKPTESATPYTEYPSGMPLIEMYEPSKQQTVNHTDENILSYQDTQ
jgi:predicted GIY-YIG superfamily endonuclease